VRKKWIEEVHHKVRQLQEMLIIIINAYSKPTDL